MRLPISVVVLTYNEEIHIERLLKNVSDWCDEIFVVDSFSTDKTLEIARKYGAKIVQHPFENQARQFNWALDNLEIKNDWILRLDADEYLTEELKNEIKGKFSFFETLTEAQPVNLPPKAAVGRERVGKKENFSISVNGYYIKRRVYFMGRWIKHGGYYPTWLLRLFRKGKGRSEQRAMDEHIVLSKGRAEKLKNDFIDDNKKSLELWIERQNRYSSRETEQVLDPRKAGEKADRLAGPAANRRKMKSFYYKMPPFFRACLYFCYRYFFRFGFLDGKEGLIFHVLQGFWYRFLVDAKIYEKQRKRNLQ